MLLRQLQQRQGQKPMMIQPSTFFWEVLRIGVIEVIIFNQLEDPLVEGGYLGVVVLLVIGDPSVIDLVYLIQIA